MTSETTENAAPPGETDDGLLLAFYGDDFTGSTDVLESLSLNGVETVLFLDPPSSDDLAAFEGIQAVGVAGQSRTMSPGEMDDHLPPVFEALGELDPELVHYKVCSTFDSSSEVGSIGHAIDLAQETFDSPFVPVVVAAPSLQPRGRYVLFGNLFATVEGTTYRLDRHPTMSDHPVTPMTEADLRRHLGEQTDREIGLLDIRSIDGKRGEAVTADLDSVADSNDVVVVDGLNHGHQRKIGRAIWKRATAASAPLFSASSSGLNYALASHWHDAGVVDDPGSPDGAEAVDRIVVTSGSASPVNEAQIEWGLSHGFAGVRLDTERLLDPETAEEARGDAVADALDALESGDSVIVYSARGPEDPAIQATRERADALGLDDTAVGERLGTEQAKLTRTLLEETGIRRACIAGGDTSGYVAPQLDVYALEFLAPVGPGSPLCLARSRDPAFDGLEIALKGGQVQTTATADDFFGAVRDGGALD